MKQRLLIVVSILIFVVICMLACDSSKPTRPDGVFIVSGTIYCDYCNVYGGFNDSLNNSIDDRYTIETGRIATITFEGPDSQITVVETNARSNYSKFLKPGIYNITVETDHTFNDYFYDVEILSDTALDLSLHYDVSVYDSIYVQFNYTDPLPIPEPYESVEEAELAYIDSLNLAIGGLLSTDSYEKFFYGPSQYNTEWMTIYELPLSGKASIAKTSNAVATELRFGGGDYPEKMWAYPIRRFGLCPDVFIIIDSFPIPHPFPWDDSGVYEEPEPLDTIIWP